MNRIVSSFSGGSYLTRASVPTLSPPASLYVSAFIYLNSTSSGFLLGKASLTSWSWLFQINTGVIGFVGSSDGSFGTLVAKTIACDTGKWYFLEGLYDSVADRIGIQLTECGDLAPTDWEMGTDPLTTLHAGSSAFFIGASPTIGSSSSLIHTVTVMAGSPTNEERAFLYAGGAGRDFWEFEDELKEITLAEWPLEEATGTRVDRASALDLSVSGAVGSSQRLIDASPYCIDSTPIDEARRLIANSYAFRDWVREGSSVPTADEALRRVHAHVVERDLVDKTIDYPCAIVHSMSSRIDRNRNGFPYGTIMFELIDAVADGADTDSARVAFTNRAGKIRREVAALGRQGGYLATTAVEMDRPIAISHPSSVPRTYSVRYSLSFGAEG